MPTWNYWLIVCTKCRRLTVWGSVSVRQSCYPRCSVAQHIAEKCIMGYNSVADNTGLSSFVLPLLSDLQNHSLRSSILVPIESASNYLYVTIGWTIAYSPLCICCHVLKNGKKFVKWSGLSFVVELCDMFTLCINEYHNLISIPMWNSCHFCSIISINQHTFGN